MDPVINPLAPAVPPVVPAPFVPAVAPKPPVPPVPAAVPAKLTGEARLNAILRILQEKHGFHFPVAVFDPKTDK